MLAEAKAAGATILKPAEDAFWGGYSGYFADPDGHPWEVAWNPEWTLLEDGSVRLGEARPWRSAHLGLGSIGSPSLSGGALRIAGGGFLVAVAPRRARSDARRLSR